MLSMPGNPWVVMVLVIALDEARVGDLQDLSSDQVEAAVTQARDLDFCEFVDAEFPIGEALRLQCSDNDFGIDFAVLHFAPDGQVWLVARDVDGFVMERSSAFWNRSRRLAYQMGRTPFLAIASWEVVADVVRVRACLSDDPDLNQDFANPSKPDPELATLLRNWECFPIPRLTENERIAAFANLWSEVRYNFAFFDQVPELDWNHAFEDFLPQVRRAESTSEFYQVLHRCLVQLQDGHTRISGPGIGRVRDSWLPFSVALDSAGDARVESVASQNSIPDEDLRSELRQAAIRPGDRLVSLDGRPVGQLLEELSPMISASTSQFREKVACETLLDGPFRSSVELEFEGMNGKRWTEVLTRSRCPVPDLGPSGAFQVRSVGAGMTYVNLPTFQDPTVVDLFRSQMEDIRRSTGLILDVRGNAGGSSGIGYDIIRHLIDRPLPSSRWRTRLYRPAHRAWGEEEDWFEGDHGAIEPEGDPFLGPVAVLVGPDTASAAEDFVVALHASKRALVVGEPTCGSTGQPLILSLPGGGSAWICTKRDTYPDGREFVGVGVIPDVRVRPSPRDLAAGVDVVLAKAIDELRNENGR